MNTGQSTEEVAPSASYQSTFSWRYGTPEMRAVFSELHKVELWRRIWVTLATVQSKAGLISREELDDLRYHERDIDIERIQEIEQQTRHDVFAAITEYAEKARKGGGKLHLGATSMDITDNAEMLRLKEALALIEEQTAALLTAFRKRIHDTADLPCMAYTHLQPAEPTTVGYRFAFYAQELLTTFDQLLTVKSKLRAKGMKGAVGSMASYTALLHDSSMSPEEMEAAVLSKLGLTAAPVSTQIGSRMYEVQIIESLAGIASGVAKFAADLRILQSPAFGEWREPFEKQQVGSSAMPFKRNPVASEKICSLARYVAQLPVVLHENVQHSYLERTLDDSANRRLVVPDAFLAVSEILKTAIRLVERMTIDERAIAQNLHKYAPFSALEGVLMQAVKHGGNRQKLHEVLKQHAMTAWDAIAQGQDNPLQQLITHDPKIATYCTPEAVSTAFDPLHHIGRAALHARQMADIISHALIAWKKNGTISG